MLCVALTFDDGYLSQLKYAIMLYKLDITGTFFLITGLREYMGRKLIVSEDVIREIVNMGHEVGSHTHTHRDLTKLSTSEVEEEFRLSKSVVEKLADCDSIGIAYPFGAFNYKVIEIARKYFLYGRTMGSFNRWNDKAIRYALGGMGVRHLVKLPIKILEGVKLVTVVFHDEPLWLLKLTVEYLNTFNVRFVSLREGLRCLGL